MQGIKIHVKFILWEVTLVDFKFSLLFFIQFWTKMIVLAILFSHGFINNLNHRIKYSWSKNELGISSIDKKKIKNTTRKHFVCGNSKNVVFFLWQIKWDFHGDKNKTGWCQASVCKYIQSLVSSDMLIDLHVLC